jgi:multidrug efflux pump subunit AcrB
MTLTAMLLTGFTLNVMTLSALALGIGLVVNSAIVVLENVLDRKRHAFRHNPNVDFKEVTSVATEELYISLMGSTLTMVVVFLPIVFINQQVKILYSGLAFTITYAMVAISLGGGLLGSSPGFTHRSSLSRGLFSPQVAARLSVWGGLGPGRDSCLDLSISGKDRADGSAGIPFRASREPLGSPPEEGEPVESETVHAHPGFWGWVKYYWYAWVWPSALSEIRYARKEPRRAYIHWCAQSLRNQKWISLVMGVAAIASILLYLFVLEKDMFGSTEQNEFIIYVELPAGAKLDVSDSVVREVERILSDTPDVAETVKTAAARVEGWSSKVYVTLRPRSERTRSVQDVISDLRPKVADIGQQFDTFIYFSEPESSKEFFIDVFGLDYDALRDLASAIAQRIQNVSGLEDVKLRYKPGQPEVQVLVDKDRAAMFGLTLRDIAEDLHARIRGLRPSYFFTDSSQMEIIARDKEQFRKSLEDIHSLTMMSPQGGNTSIQQFASFEFALTPSEVWRKDKQRVIQVSANREKLPLSTAAKKSLEALRGLEAPNGYYFQIGGDYVDMVQNEREFRFAFIVMAGLVFIVLASLFESYLQALLVMVTIPMALIGSIPLLYLTHTPATMSVYIGMIMLGGVAVSDAIVLVEKINQSRAEGRGIKQSVLEASWVRLSPILNTSLTTIVGLVPMVLSRSESAQLWTPLALTVIGGAGMATFLTLFMIPALYYHLETIKIKINRKLEDRSERTGSDSDSLVSGV